MPVNVFQAPVVLANGLVCYQQRIDNLVQSISNHREGGHWSSGGGFFVTHSYDTFTTDSINLGWIDIMDGLIVCQGIPTTPMSGSSGPPAPIAYSTAIADGLGKGATGWRKARPGNPTASLFQLTYETAHDDFPKGIGAAVAGHLIATRLRSIKSYVQLLVPLGQEFLNFAFGWKPLISDLRKIVLTQQSLDKKLSNIYRQQRKGVHRRREVSRSDTTTRTVDHPAYFDAWRISPDCAFFMDDMRTDRTVESRVLERSWFVGRFHYYIPETLPESEWRSSATAALFGSNPTPEGIWNVLPWSWLIDWFTNVGDIMSNLSSNAVDNLVADYAYIMSSRTEETVTSVVTHWGNHQNTISGSDNGGASIRSTHTRGWSSKYRGIATPYGFGVSFDSLSNYQVGILSALGITRSKFLT